MNWRRLMNKPTDFSKQGYPVFDISCTPVIAESSSAKFMAPFTLMNMGIAVFSPIVSGTGLFPYGEDKEHSWWMHWDLKMLRKCDRIAVLALPDWQDSLGIQMELELATILQKPIFIIKEGE
jgi:hypothetical protein